MAETIYLDNAATTFPKPEGVYAAMNNINRKGAVNAGRGSYGLARDASKLISETKNDIRKLVHADINVPVVFTPSITIALNQIIQGYSWKDGEYVYVSPYEHNAVARTINYMAQKRNLNVRELPINPVTEEIDTDKMRYLFGKEHPRAIFCTHVSNVTGYVLPIDEIFEEGKKYSCFTVLDTAQSLGLIELDLRVQKNIDIIAFAGHKCLYGPFGIGGFINVWKIVLNEVIVGGTGSDSLNLNMPSGNESKFEAASDNIVAIAGLKAALEVLDVHANYCHEKELTQYLRCELEKIDGVKVFAPQSEVHHVGIVSFVIEEMRSEDVGIIFDEDFGIAVRTGYHCAPFIHKHLRDEKYLGTVRVGIGKYNTRKDIDILINAVRELR